MYCYIITFFFLIRNNSDLDVYIEGDCEDDEQCTGFKSANGVAEDVSNDPNVDVNNEIG